MNTNHRITQRHTLIAIVLGLTASLSTGSPAVAGGTQSLSQCPSGRMCLWTGTGFTGTMQSFSTTGSYQSISLSVTRSAYNNRTKRTYLDELPNGGGRYSCFGPGDSDSSLSTWQLSAEAVYLSTYTNC